MLCMALERVAAPARGFPISVGWTGSYYEKEGQVGVCGDVCDPAAEPCTPPGASARMLKDVGGSHACIGSPPGDYGADHSPRPAGDELVA
jgi:hypothetical protein